MQKKTLEFFPLADFEPGSPSCLARAGVCVSRQTGGIKRPAPPNGSFLTPSIPRSGRKSNIAEHALPSPLHVVSLSALILSQREEERRAIDFAIKNRYRNRAFASRERERERRPPVAAVTLPPRSRGGRTRGGLSCFDSSHFTSFLSIPPPLRPRKGIKREKGKARLGRIHYLSARSLLLLLLSPAAGVRRRIPLDPCIARQARPYSLGLSLPRKEENGDLTTEGAHTTRLSLSSAFIAHSIARLPSSLSSVRGREAVYCVRAIDGAAPY